MNSFDSCSVGQELEFGIIFLRIDNSSGCILSATKNMTLLNNCHSYYIIGTILKALLSPRATDDSVSPER